MRVVGHCLCRPGAYEAKGKMIATMGEGERKGVEWGLAAAV